MIKKPKKEHFWRLEWTIDIFYTKHIYNWLLMTECSQNSLKNQTDRSWVRKTAFSDQQLMQSFSNK